MIVLKGGVRLDELTPQIVLGITNFAFILQSLDIDTVVTSCKDSKHSRRSLHYTGRAVDLRSRTLTEDQKDFVLDKMWKSMAQDVGNYDFLLEHRNQPNEHFHLEYDPLPREFGA